MPGKQFLVPILAPPLTTAQRDGLPAGYAPTGAVIFNTDSGTLEQNVGTDGARVWAPVGGIPTGGMIPFGGGTVPNGYLLCDGSVQVRATYQKLFDTIGTQYNTGGETGSQFRLPDLRGRAPFGRDDMGGTAANRITSGASGINGVLRGASGGAQTHTLTTAEIPSHYHDIPATSQVSGPTAGAWVDGSGKITGNTGGGGAHQNMPPALITDYIIKT